MLFMLLPSIVLLCAGALPGKGAAAAVMADPLKARSRNSLLVLILVAPSCVLTHWARVRITWLVRCTSWSIFFANPTGYLSITRLLSGLKLEFRLESSCLPQFAYTDMSPAHSADILSVHKSVNLSTHLSRRGHWKNGLALGSQALLCESLAPNVLHATWHTECSSD